MGSRRNAANREWSIQRGMLDWQRFHSERVAKYHVNIQHRTLCSRLRNHHLAARGKSDYPSGFNLRQRYKRGAFGHDSGKRFSCIRIFRWNKQSYRDRLHIQHGPVHFWRNRIDRSSLQFGSDFQPYIQRLRSE